MVDENPKEAGLTPESEGSAAVPPAPTTPVAGASAAEATDAEVLDSTPVTPESETPPPASDEKPPPTEKKGEEAEEASVAGTGSHRPYHAATTDDTTDVGALSEEPVGAPTPAIPPRRPGDWQAEMSARRIAIELRTIETKIRELLQDRDLHRRRKLAGTYRWRELEDDLNELRISRRIDPETINEIQRLVYRRHFLFTQLRFAAGTRPTWNT